MPAILSVPNIQLFDFVIRRQMKFEVGSEVPPLVRVELAIDITAIIVLDALYLGESFVPYRTLGIILQTAGVTVLVHLGLGGEKGRSRPSCRPFEGPL